MTRQKINPAIAAKKIERFIDRYVSESSAKGLVLGLSGGLDSAVVAKLAVNALGLSRVLGFIMPASATPEVDVTDAIDLARSFGMRYKIINIEPLIQEYGKLVPHNERAKGNLAARIRMSLLYYHAAIEGYLVAGTSDKSEVSIGFFTKHGDGAADILAIADLYKTQVRQLASFLGIPKEIIEKKSSPRLWEDHLAEEEIGMSYDTLDPILQMLLDKEKSPKDVAKNLGIPVSDVKRVKEMVEKSAHKRMPAPYAKL